MQKPTGKKTRMSAAARRLVIEQVAAEVFGERGYHGAGVGEIAARAGVSVPVLYDHFESKRALYVRLIVVHFEQLAGIWARHARVDVPLDSWLGAAIDEWFEYVGTHRFAGRMLFRDTTGDPEIAAQHREIEDASRDTLLPLVGVLVDRVHPSLGSALGVDLAWEVVRSLLQGLALWWYDHPDVSRRHMVVTAMNTIWIGFERMASGDSWTRRNDGGENDVSTDSGTLGAGSGRRVRITSTPTGRS